MEGGLPQLENELRARLTADHTLSEGAVEEKIKKMQRARRSNEFRGRLMADHTLSNAAIEEMIQKAKTERGKHDD